MLHFSSSVRDWLCDLLQNLRASLKCSYAWLWSPLADARRPSCSCATTLRMHSVHSKIHGAHNDSGALGCHSTNDGMKGERNPQQTPQPPRQSIPGRRTANPRHEQWTKSTAPVLRVVCGALQEQLTLKRHSPNVAMHFTVVLRALHRKQNAKTTTDDMTRMPVLPHHATAPYLRAWTALF